jgi:vanillate/3-O-methylgallate O-demethylase
MNMPQLPDLRGIPYYSEPSSFMVMMDRTWAWEFSGWKKESMSWKTGCYIHAGLSDNQMNFSGPDVIKFFESICVNNFKEFPVGSMKHAVMCLENGLIASHGILQRNDEYDVRSYAGGPWPIYKAVTSGMRVEITTPRCYLFQVAGPTCLQTLERACGESLEDIRFLRFRNAKIAGKDVEIGRIGMSGNLAYEVRGPIEEGAAVYDAVFRAGKDLGIERLGWRTYLVNHVEGGFPQSFWTFLAAMSEDRGFMEFMQGAYPPIQISGSVDPDDMRARYRTPIEVGWGNTVKLNHEFLGRQALEKELADPKRTVATLVWNEDDVVDIYRSLFKPGEEYRTIDMPTTPPWTHGMNGHADHLLKGGQAIGHSSGTIYSYFFRQIMSMACIDVDQSKIGSEIEVRWGDYGKRIKSVRATVARFPYLTEGRNSDLDTKKPAV